MGRKFTIISINSPGARYFENAPYRRNTLRLLYRRHEISCLYKQYRPGFHISDAPMAKQSYLDYIQTLLPESEWTAFSDFYQQKLPKTIKIVTTKISAQDFKNLVTEL